MPELPLRVQPQTASSKKSGAEIEGASSLPIPGAKARGWRYYVSSIIAGELSVLTRYYDRVIQWLPRADDTGLLLDLIDVKHKTLVSDQDPFPSLVAEDERTAVLINGTLNHHYDIQRLLVDLKLRLSRTSRVLLVLYNPYLRWLYQVANRCGIRNGELPSTFITRTTLLNLAKLSGFEVVWLRACVCCPWRLLGLGNMVNRLVPLVPILRWLCLTSIVVLRPILAQRARGISCVIPARNERGNIESALARFPDLGCRIEIIFVEGHSVDGTWNEIQRGAELYRDQFDIKTLQQTGKGKADAVRLGFAHATQPLLTILDADLTMPPEMLGRFYQAYCEGHGDFINGSRLVYPMEGNAMRFLNRLGNIFFAKALSWILDQRIGDSLCGTKLMTRYDYQRLVAWRRDFGDFDPFGDFELLFPAAVLGLGIIDVPVRYLARIYGRTNIHRFRHGWQLLRMTCIGLWRLKMRIGQYGKS